MSGTIGTSAPRARDLQLLTGRGRYVADLDLPGQVWARVVRSPVAHATLLGVATEAAREHRGVLAVLTAADVPDVRIPIRLPFAATSEGGQVLQPVLAREVVRYVGEPVALVLAEDPWAAEDAAELVELDLDVLDAAGDPVAASTGGPLVHEALGSNVVNTIPLRFGDVEAAFAAADVVVRRRLELQRQTGAPLETRGLLAEPVGGGVTIHGAAKVKHFNRGVLAELLGLALDDVRLVEVDVGGGFGVRGELYPEDVLVPFAALRLGRPVKWIEDRAEHLVATNHARGQVHDIEVAATAEGRLLALRGTAWVDQGAYVRTQGILPTILPGHHLPGPYAWEAFELTAHAVLTHRTPVGTYRGPGMTEAAFVRERLLDVLAAELRLDPVELRRRNLIPADRMPFVYDLGAESPPIAYESGDFAGGFERLLATAGYDTLCAERDRRRASGEHVGIGVAATVELGAIGPFEDATVTVGDDGTVVVRVGVASLGQGVETVLAQIAADELGVDLDASRSTTTTRPTSPRASARSPAGRRWSPVTRSPSPVARSSRGHGRKESRSPRPARCPDGSTSRTRRSPSGRRSRSSRSIPRPVASSRSATSCCTTWGVRSTQRSSKGSSRAARCRASRARSSKSCRTTRPASRSPSRSPTTGCRRSSRRRRSRSCSSKARCPATPSA